MEQNANPAERPTSPNYSVYVAIGILALGAVVVLGLFVPPVAKVGEAANRARSSSNVRQIAIAIMEFESTHGHLPLVCDHGPNSPTGFGVRSLHFEILPFIEGNTVHQLYSLQQPQTYYSATGAARSVFRAYISPSDPSAPDGAVKDVTVEAPGAESPFAASFLGSYATASYVVNGMVFTRDADGKMPTSKIISDGISNTIIVGERFQLCQQASDTVPTLWGMGAYSATTASFALSGPAEPHPKIVSWPLRQFVPSSRLPVGNWPKFQVNPKPGTCESAILQTPHKGGMLVGLADGSGRSINPSISTATFWAVVTPAGNETMGVDWP